MHARLLTCASADDLAVECNCDRIGLGIFEGHRCHKEVEDGVFSQVVALGNHIFQQIAGDWQVVAGLLQLKTEDIADFSFGCGLIICINLEMI